jgi:hypothetical protein
VTPVAYSLFEDGARALRWGRPSLAPWRRLVRRRERRRAWRLRARDTWHANGKTAPLSDTPVERDATRPER